MAASAMCRMAAWLRGFTAVRIRRATPPMSCSIPSHHPCPPAVQRAYTQRRARQRHVQRMRLLAQGQEAEVASEPAQALPPRQPSPQPHADKARRGASRRAVQQEVRRPRQQQPQQQSASKPVPQAPDQHGAWGRLLFWLRPNRQPQQPKASPGPADGTSAAQPAPAAAPKTPPQQKQLRRRPAQPGGAQQRPLPKGAPSKAAPPAAAPAGATQRSPRQTPPAPPAAAASSAGPPSSPRPAQQPGRQEPLPSPKAAPEELPPTSAPSPAPPSPAAPEVGSTAGSVAPSRAGSRAGSSSSIIIISSSSLAGTELPSQPLADVSSPAAAAVAAAEGADTLSEGVEAAAGGAEGALPAARRSDDISELLPALAHVFAASEAAEAAAAAAGVAAAPAPAQGPALAATAAARQAGPVAAPADPRLIVQAMLPPEQPPTPHQGGSGVGRQPALPQAAGSAAVPAAAAEQEPHDSELCIGKLASCICAATHMAGSCHAEPHFC